MRKYGEQKKLFISPGLLPEMPSEPGLPKPEHSVTPKKDSGEAGWRAGKEGWVAGLLCTSPHLSVVLLSISKLIHSSPLGTSAALDEAKSKPAVSQGDQQV